MTNQIEFNKEDIYDDLKKSIEKEILQKNEKDKNDCKSINIWKNAINLIEKKNYNDAYELILNSGDDIYLLRLILITGIKLNYLKFDIAKKVLMRVNMICRSHQIQLLLINLIKDSIQTHIYSNLNRNEQNDILDSLYEFSGFNTTIGAQAAYLYEKLTS